MAIRVCDWCGNRFSDRTEYWKNADGTILCCRRCANEYAEKKAKEIEERERQIAEQRAEEDAYYDSLDDDDPRKIHHFSARQAEDEGYEGTDAIKRISELSVAKMEAVDASKYREAVAERRKLLEKEGTYQLNPIKLNDKRVLDYFDMPYENKRIVIFKDGTYQYRLENEDGKEIVGSIGETNYKKGVKEFFLKALYVGFKDAYERLQMDSSFGGFSFSTEQCNGEELIANIDCCKDEIDWKRATTNFTAQKWGYVSDYTKEIYDYNDLPEEKIIERQKERDTSNEKIKAMYQSQIIPVEDPRVAHYYFDVDSSTDLTYTVFNDGTAQCVFYDNRVGRTVVGWFGKAEVSKDSSGLETTKITCTHDYVIEKDYWREGAFFEKEIYEYKDYPKGYMYGGRVDLKTTGLSKEQAKKNYEKLEKGGAAALGVLLLGGGLTAGKLFSGLSNSLKSKSSSQTKTSSKKSKFKKILTGIVVVTALAFLVNNRIDAFREERRAAQQDNVPELAELVYVTKTDKKRDLEKASELLGAIGKRVEKIKQDRKITNSKGKTFKVTDGMLEGRFYKLDTTISKVLELEEKRPLKPAKGSVLYRGYGSKAEDDFHDLLLQLNSDKTFVMYSSWFFRTSNFTEVFEGTYEGVLKQGQTLTLQSTKNTELKLLGPKTNRIDYYERNRNETFEFDVTKTGLKAKTYINYVDSTNSEMVQVK